MGNHSHHNCSGHNHEHSHSLKENYSSVNKTLKSAIVVTVLIFILELYGGYLTKSLALLGDAWHIFADLFALLISLFSIKLSQAKPNAKYTYGKHRISILASLLNNLLLIATCGYIVYESIERFSHPVEIKGFELLIIAVIGLIFNLVILSKLHGHSHDNLNVQSAFFHILGDTLSSVGVVIVSLAIIFIDQPWVRFLDPIMSVIIVLIIMNGVIKMLKKIYFILMDTTPEHTDIPLIINELKLIDKVEEVHDVHIRSITDNLLEFKAHVVLPNISLSDTKEVRKEIESTLKSKFDFYHIVIEFETDDTQESIFCQDL